MVESYDPLKEQLELAKQLEAKDQWEPAYKNFHDVASKALTQMANEKDPVRKKQLQEIANSAITDAQWSKQMI